MFNAGGLPACSPVGAKLAVVVCDDWTLLDSGSRDEQLSSSFLALSWILGEFMSLGRKRGFGSGDSHGLGLKKSATCCARRKARICFLPS
jgi:hypothetical protein